MTTGAEINRNGRKFEQVLEGARRIFLADGFEGANVDDIARAAGVSKATLYSYVPDKRVLFMEVARTECRRQSDEAVELIDDTAPPDTVLRAGARRLIGILMSDFSKSMFRICMAESHRFPELGRNFYESGPALGRERFSGYLRRAAARGELVIDDFDLAADQFIELCKADIFLRVLCGIIPAPTEADVTRVVEGAVSTFLARYGAAVDARG
jgi:AcrR family transcriptional regulator